MHVHNFEDPDKVVCPKCGWVGCKVTFEARSEKVTVSGEHLRFNCARCGYQTLHRCLSFKGRGADV